jgi:hypothetical protein
MQTGAHGVFRSGTTGQGRTATLGRPHESACGHLMWHMRAADGAATVAECMYAFQSACCKKRSSRLTRRLTGRLTSRLTNRLTSRLTRRLIRRLTHRLTDWSVVQTGISPLGLVTGEPPVTGGVIAVVPCTSTPSRLQGKTSPRQCQAAPVECGSSSVVAQSSKYRVGGLQLGYWQALLH